MFRPAPVGLPGLAALALGFFLFLLALFAARRRALGGPTAMEARRSNRSWAGIALQAMAIGTVAIGPVRVGLDPLSGPSLLRAGTVLLLMLGATGLFHAASRAMGRNWSIVARTRTDHQLVQCGPFAHVRHPIYVALFLLLPAFALAYGHERALAIGVPLYCIGTLLRVRHEERLLRAQFGGAYDLYAGRVKRFVPGWF
ncbi:methyltransferase family protein [Sphingomonas aracearum]|uniref:methyltransferase family protein n=1 Tax=Sphingomonas aracearum TaxID=2283317 RepID=UPI0015F04CFF|nr:isoprenylcysteine carboxylmethyltransferase family protein [Sphingomonas aracearum]